MAKINPNNFKNKNFKNAGLYLLILIVVISVLSSFFEPSSSVSELSYSQFLSEVESNNVISVSISGNTATGELSNNQKFSTYLPDDPELMNILRDKNINIEAKPPVELSWWMRILSSLLPMALIIGIWIFMMRQMQGGGNKVMSFGKSQAKLMGKETPKVTFEDVAGVDEAKEELQEVIEFLKNPAKFNQLGAKIPKGVLLYGPPGSGKTLLARAVAGEAGVAFFSISGSDFVEMFVGVGASRVRDLFKQAKTNNPCIIFMDEIDAVGRHRGAGLGGGHDEREQTLNQLLVEMDGFDQNIGVILIAATNRPDVLDPALLRPGRFDRRIVVDRPDLLGREQILKVHAKGKPLNKDVDLKVLARRTPGFVGSDLANLVNEAALLASRKGKKSISMEEFEASIDRVIAGPERRSRLMNEKEKEIVAYHESGHALVAKLLPNGDPVHKVSIIPRGSAALGYTLQLPTEDRFLISKSELMQRLSVLLGGRVAEEIIFKDITTGAQNDLERATKIARQMVTEFGMSETIGPMTLGRKEHQIFLGRDISEDRNYSDEIAFQIDKEVEKIIENAYSKAKEILIKNKRKLKKVATTLLQKETLEGEELDSLMKGAKLATGQQLGV
ncbi:MAG: ATP-dependent zinc metalloprotease FtsH [Candidatus Caldatribacteriota bacterium]|nr:ATP-dependent zinc metalloprotease FtsH [Atribacterota bacterium]MDD3030764.1 ATP-dependent zinc metalloprotease FtsH [Atribacterota bacterium]MDD3640423.1 ATP-dependent zinc metalloprotease FtsH [Atribacterota bacterium]MDD4288215.1 ATP-dependent zinc metalloprotease FtsH [Atribacterota bacterium]MDD4764434.1 ATP-dependent zinc metalloprotease FtsH [Atribacterota bacterium]